MGDIRFDGRVALVTGAGHGLGRAHALGLAARGAKVVVNDLGTSLDGTTLSPSAAERVVAEIHALGGEAIADGSNVADVDRIAALMDRVVATWGRIDIVVNNAGILRDKSFAKMGLADFKAVLDVHLMGSVICTKAAWGHMRKQNYGRIVFTSSSSGLYGNFGQANYGAAKCAMVGLMNVLHIEGGKYDIRVNTLAPTAATRMTEGLLEADAARRLSPDSITPGLLYLVSEEAPSRMILAAGAGCFAQTRITETVGIYLAPDERKPESLAARIAEITDTSGEEVLLSAFEQTNKFSQKAADESGKPAQDALETC